MKKGIVELNQNEIDEVSGAPLGKLIVEAGKWIAKKIAGEGAKKSAKRGAAVEVAYEGAAPSTPQNND